MSTVTTDVTTEVTSEILGFADTGDSRNKVLGDTLIGVTYNTTGDARVQVDFLGDFGDLTMLYPDEWFKVSIDGYELGKFQGIQSQYTTSSLSISATDWANIIKDGTIGITYTMGPEVDNLDTNPNEFIKLKFSWERPSLRDPGPTQVTGTDAGDVLKGTDGKNIINGLLGNDTISAGGNNDIVKGGLGNDQINGGNHSDALYGEQGNDSIFGDDGNDIAYGGAGNDLLDGGAGHDFLYGGAGRDTLKGGAGNDFLKGANGDDVLNGGAGNDELYGGAGHDKLSGGVGNDELFGNRGNDSLFGGSGKDVLDGGLGDDELSGGLGVDTFVFGKKEGDDVIRGFEANHDLIKLNGQTYTAVENADGDTVLELSGGGSVTLLGIALEDVQSDWFL